MAYNTKYRITFSDLHTVNAGSWKIDLQLADYDGDIIALQPAASPLTINFGADSDNTDDKTATLIGTEADITIVITDTNFDKTEFWVTEETVIKVIIYRNEEVYFSGFVKPDFCAYPYMQPPYEFTISASDGIGFLKGILVDLYEEARGENQIGIVDLLTTRGLYKAQNDEVQTLMLLSSLRRIGLLPLHNEHIRCELLYDDPATHTFLDIYTVLDYIATSYGFRIITSEGKYWALRIPDMPKNTIPTLYRFNTPDFTPIMIGDYELIKELGSIDDIATADLIFSNNDSYITIQPPYKTIKNDLKYTFTGNLLNYDWFYFDSGEFQNWTKLDSNCVVHQITNFWDATKKSLYIEGYDTSGGTWIYQQRSILYGFASINLKTNVRFYGYDWLKLNFRIYFPDGTLAFVYDENNSGWNTNAGGIDGDMNIRMDEGVLEKDINFDLPFWDSPTFGSGAGVSQPYIFEVRVLNAISPTTDTTRPTGITEAGIEVGPLILTFTYNDRIGDSITVDNPKNYSSVKSVDNFKLIDSEPFIYNQANAINYPAETEKENWISDDQNYGSDKFHVTQFRSLMDLCSYPYENMTGTYYSNTISPNHVIKRKADNKLFIVMSDEYDVKNCLHKMKLFEIKDTETTDPTLVVKEEYKKGEAFNKL